MLTTESDTHATMKTVFPLWCSQAEHIAWNSQPMTIRLDLFKLSRSPQHCLLIGGSNTKQGPLLELIANYLEDSQYQQRESAIHAKNSQWYSLFDYQMFKRSVTIVHDKAWEEFAQACVLMHSVTKPVVVHFAADDCELLAHDLFPRSREVILILMHLMNNAPGIRMFMHVRGRHFCEMVIQFMLEAFERSNMDERINCLSCEKIGLLAKHRKMERVDTNGQKWVFGRRSQHARDMLCLPDTSVLEMVPDPCVNEFYGKYHPFRRCRVGAYR